MIEVKRKDRDGCNPEVTSRENSFFSMACGRMVLRVGSVLLGIQIGRNSRQVCRTRFIVREQGLQLGEGGHGSEDKLCPLNFGVGVQELLISGFYST